MMKILIFGGAGYVGSTMTRKFWEDGHDVTVFDKMEFGAESLVPLLSKPRFRLIRGDIRAAAQVRAAAEGQDAACLLAAIVGEPACNRDPDLARETNLGGARNVLKACQNASVGRLAFASTCSNYGVADTSAPVPETAPLNPISVYSETKVVAEQEIMAANCDTLTTTVLRLSTAFGISARMRFDLLVSDFSWAAARDNKIAIYGEQFWRPFVHVDDIAKAFGIVLGADPKVVGGDVFNVGDNGNNTQKAQLGEMVQSQFPDTQIEFVKRNQDPRSYRVDFTKINQRLGYKPDWTISEGIAELRTAFDANVWPNPDAPHYRN